LCRRHGALLIFDEVISGFRLGFGGFAGMHGFEPDLVTYGKVIGGGFPVGAYGGKREYMELVAPVGPVYQAGTLSANLVAMCAGLATLEQLADGTIYRQLEDLGQFLDEQHGDIPGLTVQRVVSLFWPYLADQAAPIRSLADMKTRPAAPFGPVFHRLLDAGIYLAPSAFEVGFLSARHSRDHVETLARELRAAITASRTTTIRGRAAMRRTAVAGHGVGVLAAFAMLLAGACAQREPGEALHRVTIATGPAGTAYHQIGTNLSTVIEQQLDIASTARPHTGSSLYIPQMHRGELPFGLNNATDTAAAYRGQLVYAPPLDNLRAAMLVSRSPFSTSC